MPYTTNPHLPRLRMEAAKLVIKQGWSTRAVSRHTGFNQSTIVRWVASAQPRLHKQTPPTRSSRPKSHPRKLEHELVDAILRYRAEYRRCAEVIHHLLVRDGYTVSLSSVKRTLRRHGLVYPSKWKKWHQYPPRPLPEKPGVLVEIDTIHDGGHDRRLYIYTLLDVHSRWAYAWPTNRICSPKSLRFVQRAQQQALFTFQTLQSDHRSEFAKWFTTQMHAQGFTHRHSRVRTPNDNAHLERFNRTIQEECLSRTPRSLRHWQKAIPEYLRYYNNERPHMGLGMKSPVDML